MVSREGFTLDDEIAKKRHYNYKKGFIKVTTYSSQDKKFRIAMPDYMHGVLGYKEVKEDSQDEADTAFRKAVSEYDFRLANKRKVIYYTIMSSFNAEVDGKKIEKDTLGLYGDRDKRAAGLALWFAVCYETKFQDDNYYHRGLKYCDENFQEIGKPHYHAEMQVMAWTEERETFFNELRDRITQLSVNAESFINSNKKLADLIDHNQALPYLKIGEPK